MKINPDFSELEKLVKKMGAEKQHAKIKKELADKKKLQKEKDAKQFKNVKGLTISAKDAKNWKPQQWKTAEEINRLAKLKIKKLQKQLEAKNLSEKKAGRLGEKIRIIRLGIIKPKRGK